MQVYEVHMLHITLGAARAVNPREDPLGRSIVGYAEWMTAEELHEANRGCWVLGERADREQFALFSYDGIVRQAMQIDRIVPAGERRALEGTVLGRGHDVYDAFVGKPAPTRTRNPVAYVETEVAAPACACGCGAAVTKGYFVPGHDQKAVHERVAKVGTVREFIEWFDEVWPSLGAN